MKKSLILLPLLLIGAVLFWFGKQTVRAGYESPAYKVEKKDGSFEIRNYPTIVAAATKTTNQNSGFGKLFQFISGENEGDQKIAMTTPVFMPATADGRTAEMMFVVPKDVVSSGVPKPKAKDVSIKKMSSGRFAVIRTSGRLDNASKKSMLKKLRAEIEKRGLKTAGNPIYAGYDPPWTPGPMRRNEVMLRLR